MPINFEDITGCQSHGCIIKKPTGMATNGGCQCFNNRNQHVMIKRYMCKLESRIKTLEDAVIILEDDEEPMTARVL